MISAGIRNSSSSTMLGVSGGLMGQSSNSRKAQQPGDSNNSDLDNS